MDIKDLSPRMGNVEIVLDIIEKGNVREFDKFGKKGRVCNFVCTDTTGRISITLWNDDIDKVNAGDTIQIKNGWVSEYQGELQLSTGKFGELILKGKSISKAETEPKVTTTEAKKEKTKPNHEDEEIDELYKNEESVDDE